MDCKENYQPCAFNNRTAIARHRPGEYKIINISPVGV